MPKEQLSGKPQTRRYTPDEKAAAVRLVRTLRAELGTEHGTVQRVATQLGYGVESVRLWVKQADIDEGHAPGFLAAVAHHAECFELSVSTQHPQPRGADCDDRDGVGVAGIGLAVRIAV